MSGADAMGEVATPEEPPATASKHRGGGAAENARTRARRNERMCIVTRERDPDAGLIRFVAGPDGEVVPDLAGKLPGRGAHVAARYDLVDRAAHRQMFRRALRAEARAPADLADRTGAAMRDALVRTLPLLRKAGDLVAGAGKVDGAVRNGEVLLVLHASDAAEDGVRKIAAARWVAGEAFGVDIGADPLFTVDELGLAFGGDRVIHAAIRRSGGGEAFAARLRRYRSYCGDSLRDDDGRRREERTGNEPLPNGTHGRDPPDA